MHVTANCNTFGLVLKLHAFAFKGTVVQSTTIVGIMPAYHTALSVTLNLSVNFKINVSNFLYRTVVRKRQKDLYNIQCMILKKRKRKRKDVWLYY